MRHGLELVVEIVNHLRERHFVHEDHPLLTQVFGANKCAAPIRAQLHQNADVLGGNEKADFHNRFAKFLDLAGIGDILRTVNDDGFAIFLLNLVGDVWCGLNQVQVAIAFQALLDDLAMQHPQEAAAETETQSVASFRLICEWTSFESELGQGFPQILEFVVVDG